jgi:multiple sugar transport system ATP-binding protein
MAEVVLEGLSKRFANGVVAVRDLSLSIRNGELVVLVGPSGCGKTTTLRLIAGLEEPSAGTIRIGGRLVNLLPPRKRDVAMVFQRPALYPHLTVRENLAFSLRLRQPALRRLCQGLAHLVWPGFVEQTMAARVKAAACALRLQDVLDRLPAQLSGGQQQRVALGRALVRDPAAFLLDEPLSNLDTGLRADLRHELHLLHERLRTTMIYVTHDQVEAMTLGDRVVVLRQGVAEQVDGPVALYERPCNRFVAGFIGWPSMNFVDGEVVERDGQAEFVVGEQGLNLPPALRSWLQHRGKPATLGIRPKDIALGPGLVMRATLVEPLGDGCLVTLDRGEWHVTAQLRGAALPREQEQVEVTFDMNAAHLFDRTNARALAHGGPGG